MTQKKVFFEVEARFAAVRWGADLCRKKNNQKILEKKIKNYWSGDFLKWGTFFPHLY